MGEQRGVRKSIFGDQRSIKRTGIDYVLHSDRKGTSGGCLCLIAPERGSVLRAKGIQFAFKEGDDIDGVADDSRIIPAVIADVDLPELFAIAGPHGSQRTPSTKVECLASANQGRAIIQDKLLAPE